MIKINRKVLAENIRYTDLVYERINKKLNINLTHLQIKKMINNLILGTSIKDFHRKGKNIYIYNYSLNIGITINFNSKTVITANIINRQGKSE